MGTSIRGNSATNPVSTLRCNAGSPGAPRGNPSGHGTESARGGRTFLVTSGSMVRDAVTIPRRSISA
jgi:hypothetical protein